MRPTTDTSCDSCGTHTGVDTHCCGRCAEDYNARDREAGLRRLNGRRQANGLPKLVLVDGSFETEGGDADAGTV